MEELVDGGERLCGGNGTSSGEGDGSICGEGDGEEVDGARVFSGKGGRLQVDMTGEEASG